MRYVLVLIIVLIPTFTYASNSWYHTTTTSPSFPSAEAACKAFPYVAALTFSHLVPRGSSNLQFTCYYKRSDGTTYSDPPVLWVSRPAVCPPGTYQDAETFECKSLDPCGELEGQEVEWDSSEVVFSACMTNKCEAVMTNSIYASSNKRQAYKTDVNEDVLFRNYGVYSGQSCFDPSGSPSDTPAPQPTESSSSNNCTATVTDAEGRQVSSCEDTDIFKDQRACLQAGGALGTTDFGTGAMLTCVQSKGPKATQTNTQTQKTVEPTANGGTKTTTTTTTTVKNCIGTNACTTKTTTNTHTSVTNGDGTPGEETNNCKGADCKGSGDKSGEGEDKGDDEEDDGIPGPSTALAKGEQSSLQDAFSEWDEKIEAARGELDEKIAQYSDLFSGVFDLNLGSSSGSLPCKQVPISFGATKTTLDMCLDNFSEPLGYIRYALLLAAAALAALIILR